MMMNQIQNSLTRHIASLSVLLVILTLSLSPAPATAQEIAADTPPAEQAKVAVTLIPETEIVLPGETITIGIRQDIADGWHTYWLNPGDSGEPMHVDWSLPDGFTVSGEKDVTHWPVPHKFMIGELVGYGYQGHATFLQTLNIPDTAPAGETTLTAQIELLVCAEICVPEFKTRTLSLTVLEKGSPKPPAPETALPTDPFMQDRMHMPVSWDGTASYKEENGDLIITLSHQEQERITSLDNLLDPVFIPLEWGIIKDAAATSTHLKNGTLVINHARGERTLPATKTINGILTFTGRATDSLTGISISATHEDSVTPAPALSTATPDTEAPDAQTAGTPAPPQTPHISILSAILFALLGGIILNLMPCVFPVLSLKALKLCKLSGHDLTVAKRDSFYYTAGILVAFSLFALALMTFQVAGQKIGWGFQLQNAAFVMALSWLLYLIGLNLSGFYTFNIPLSGAGSKLTMGESRLAAFFTGVLAALVASPCTAPFMGVAIGFALTQSPIVTLAVFLALGVGLALPYVLLALIPTLRNRLPKPGAWMERFKQFLAFPLYASAIWLIWVSVQQGGTVNVIWALSGALLLTFAIWMFQHRPQGSSAKLFLRFIAALALLSAFSLLGFVSLMQMPAPVLTSCGLSPTAEKSWQPYSPQALETALASPDPVFVNMTADWCITCKVNERVALATTKTEAVFQEYNVRKIKGDWTNYDPDITAYLKDFGRNGVPLYIYYAAPESPGTPRPAPQILPQILTPGTIQHAITNKD